MRSFSYILLGSCLALSACSITPYRSEVACRAKDNYGKCINIEEAYDEAVTGASSAASRLAAQGKQVSPTQTEKKRGRKARKARRAKRKQAKATDSVQETLEASVPAEADQYGLYRTALYEQLRSLLAAPSAPMVRPAQTVRTLIVSYAKREDAGRLYMPRYVFSISDGPSFVMGQYLDRRQERASTTLKIVKEPQ